ncbi:MAG: site-2 protease family protein, partial [Chlamydiota bacterium]
MSKPKHQPLPQFRKDLEFYSGPEESDGSPTYNIFDPLKGQYFKINWAQYQIIINLEQNMSLKQLIQKINQKTTLKVNEDQIRYFFNHAASMGILALPKAAEQLDKESSKKTMKPLKWLLTHYLYFRIPLFSPDNFLEKTLPYVKVFVSWPAISLYIILTLFGLGQVFSRFDEFINTFSYLFSFKGIISLGLVMTAVKVLHELGHAYTAKYYGISVRKMGLAFLVLWPVMYTDVTDVWRLSKRSQRFAISAAGIIVELIVAGVCSFLWAMSSSGILQSLFFLIASSTWLSTLLINTNPAMRFDGYYLLSDLWGIDNLQPRAFAVTRWKLRELFLGLKAAPPEQKLTKRRIRGLVIYSLFTWTYRLFLYTAIALFVYGYFTKVLGVFLFIMEIGVFIIWPLSSEIQEIYKQRDKIKPNLHIALTSVGLLIVTFWFAFPFSHTLYFPALTVPANQQVIYIPYDGIIKEIHVERNDQVKSGDKIVTIYSKPLTNKIQELSKEKEMLERQVKILTFSDDQKNNKVSLPEKKAEIRGVREHIRGLEELRNKLSLNAQISGKIFSWDNSLKKNQPVAKDRILGKIAGNGNPRVLAFVDEEYIREFSVGKEV